MDHREIAVRVAVMNEVQFPFPSEPCKPLKPRSLYMVFLVEKDMRGVRRCTCGYLNHEEIDRRYEVCARSCRKHGNEEEGRIVTFVAKLRPRDEMIFGIAGMMEVDVIDEEHKEDCPMWLYLQTWVPVLIVALTAAICVIAMSQQKPRP
jgi:hypothetical protein